MSGDMRSLRNSSHFADDEQRGAGDAVGLDDLGRLPSEPNAAIWLSRVPFSTTATGVTGRGRRR